MYMYVHQPYPKLQPVNVVLQLVNFDGSPFWLSLDRVLARVWHWKSFNYWCLNLFQIYQKGLKLFSPCTFFNFKVCYLLIYSQNFYLRTQFQFILRSLYLKSTYGAVLVVNQILWNPNYVWDLLELAILRATFLSIQSYHTCSLFMSVRRIKKLCNLSLTIIGIQFKRILYNLPGPLRT